MPWLKPFAFIIISLILYILCGYYLQRTQSLLLISLYSGLFIVYLTLGLKRYPAAGAFKAFILAGFLFRFLLLFSLPVLSDDVYRFIWDGYIQSLGYNPFDHTPRELLAIENNAFLQQLFPKLNSPDYYSVYPQVCQSIFRLSAEIAGNSVPLNNLILKSLILIAECSTLALLSLLLGPEKRGRILIYWLNPLIILELTGNIHFEALMITLVLLLVWLLKRGGIFASALSLAMAIQTKLLPLVLIPLLLRRLSRKRSVLFFSLTIGFTLLLSLVSLNSMERILNFMQSLRLYYGNFEFNGSIYLLLRTLGWALKGYNPIGMLAPLLLLCTMLGWLILYLKKLPLAHTVFWMLCIYLFCSAIVHPWYLSPLIALSVFLNYRFAIVWSALIPLTYLSYGSIPYQENYWIVGLEYMVAGWFMFRDLKLISSTRTSTGS